MNYAHVFFNDMTNKDEKNKIAKKVTQFLKDKDVIGVGSGSTSYLALLALKEKAEKENITFSAIPTSREMELVCQSLGIMQSNLLSGAPNWAFDGADEIDAEHSLIKGRGGALFREKLVMKSSPITYILADSSKFVESLGKKVSLPIEIFPEALHLVTNELKKFPVTNLSLRLAKGKDGPIITESGNFILDVKFSNIELAFEKEIKSIPGVIETGLFIGHRVKIIN